MGKKISVDIRKDADGAANIVWRYTPDTVIAEFEQQKPWFSTPEGEAFLYDGAQCPDWLDANFISQPVRQISVDVHAMNDESFAILGRNGVELSEADYFKVREWLNTKDGLDFLYGFGEAPEWLDLRSITETPGFDSRWFPSLHLIAISLVFLFTGFVISRIGWEFYDKSMAVVCAWLIMFSWESGFIWGRGCEK